MDRKRILASVVVFLILAVLVYLQYRHWRTFDWGTFWSQTHRIKKIHVLHAIALVYAAYVLRALRWKRPWFKVSAISGRGCSEVTKAIARELFPDR